MSELARMCQQLDAVAGDITQMASELASISSALNAAASRAAQMSGESNGNRSASQHAAQALSNAARACGSAAQNLAHAGRTGRAYVRAEYSGAGASATAGALEADAGAAASVDAGAAGYSAARSSDGSAALSVSQSEFMGAEFKTAAGSAFFYADDAEYRSAAADVPAFEGEYVLDLHGSPDAVSLYGKDRGEQKLSAAEFAEVVRSSTAWNGDPIRLFACNTGETPGGFAQQLANELGVAVTAPTDSVWSISGGGKPIVSAPQFDSKTGRHRPIRPHTGRWVRFDPFSHQG